MKFRFVQEYRETFRVGSMCRVLGVSRSGYYAWRRRGPSTREIDDAKLAKLTRTVHRESRETYGSPRVHRALRAQGVAPGKHRVARIMRLEGIRGRTKQRFARIATSRGDMPAAPNRLARRFRTSTPNRVWVGDMTQIRTQQGWLHLAVLIDLYSRKVVGWATGSRPQQELALDALEHALASRRPAPGLLHHTDRGGAYSSADCQDLLDRNGLVCSMSRSGNCYDNAVAESLFHTLKTEWLFHFNFPTRDQARLAVFDYIETFYNRSRLHSTLNYQSPDDFEKIQSTA